MKCSRPRTELIAFCRPKARTTRMPPKPRRLAVDLRSLRTSRNKGKDSAVPKQGLNNKPHQRSRPEEQPPVNEGEDDDSAQKLNADGLAGQSTPKTSSPTPPASSRSRLEAPPVLELDLGAAYAASRARRPFGGPRPGPVIALGLPAARETKNLPEHRHRENQAHQHDQADFRRLGDRNRTPRRECHRQRPRQDDVVDHGLGRRRRDQLEERRQRQPQKCQRRQARRCNVSRL